MGKVGVEGGLFSKLGTDQQHQLCRDMINFVNVQVCSLDCAVTDLHCSPSGGKKQQGTAELFAVACADGELVHHMHVIVVTFKKATLKAHCDHCRIAEADPQQWEG